MSDHEPSGRVAAVSAAIDLAIEEAGDDDSGGWTYRSGSDVERSDVEREVSQDVSQRTVDRALKDAAALGWLVDKRQGWDAGPKAEEVAPEPEEDTEKVTVCNDCEAVWQGRTTSCADCGSEWIRQVEPGDPDRSPI